MLDDLTFGEQSLANFMSEISERCYSAGWMEDLEYVLWDAVINGEKPYGHGKVTNQDIQILKLLSDYCKGWIYFDEQKEETVIDFKSWGQKYDSHIS